MDDKVSFLFQYPKLSREEEIIYHWEHINLFCTVMELEFGNFMLLWSMATKLELDSDQHTGHDLEFKILGLCSLKFQVYHSDP